MVEIQDIFLKNVLKRIENIVLITGFAGAGKSTFIIRLANELLKNDYKIYFFDTEGQLSLERQKLFINPEKIIIKKSIFFEDLIDEFFKITNKLDANEKIAFIWDSVAGTSLKSEFEIIVKEGINEFSSTGIAFMSRLLSLSLRNISPIITKQQIPFIITNQYRQKINLNPYSGIPASYYGEKGNMPGGEALKHFSSSIIELTRKEQDDDGIWVKIRLLKSKIQPPTEIEYFLNYSLGFDENYNLFKYAIKKKLIKQSGGWYEWNDKKYRHDDLLIHIFKSDKELEKLRKLVEENYQPEIENLPDVLIVKE